MSTSVESLEARFYRRLLDLSRPDELGHVLDQIIELLVRLTGSHVGYLEISEGEHRVRSAYPSAAGDATLAAVAPEIIRRVVVRGKAVATRCEVAAEPAGPLERFVLCMPIKPAAGVIYLQGGDAFGASARDHTALVSRRLGERALLRHGTSRHLPLRDATRQFQGRHVLAALERTEWNVTAAARELGVARSYLHKLIATHHLQPIEE